MVKKKADRSDKPRVVKTWRIRKDVVKELERLCKIYTNYSESEIIEDAILRYEQGDGG